jgi:hypothetical protein
LTDLVARKRKFKDLSTTCDQSDGSLPMKLSKSNVMMDEDLNEQPVQEEGVSILLYINTFLFVFFSFNFPFSSMHCIGFELPAIFFSYQITRNTTNIPVILREQNSGDQLASSHIINNNKVIVVYGHFLNYSFVLCTNWKIGSVCGIFSSQ